MIELTLPEFDADGKSTKDLVIFLLLKQHPLTAKQLWYKVNRLFARSISYQGVYKTVSALHESKVLVRSEIGYEISMEWVRRIRDFTQCLESACGDTMEADDSVSWASS